MGKQKADWQLHSVHHAIFQGRSLCLQQFQMVPEDAIAKCLLQVVNEFKLLDGIPALVFDIATSNTGQWKGSSIIFKALLKYPLFWLACRHHMPELFIKHASTTIVEEITKIQWRNKGSR